MAKFCGKCGARLDEVTGLCPNCYADKMQKDSKKKSKSERRTQKKAAKREKRARWSTGKKIRRFFLKLILTVIILAVLAVGITGTLVYFDVVDIPVVERIIAQLGFGSDKPTDDLYFQSLSNGFTDRKITDKESALEALEDVADVIGIENVQGEFVICEENTISDNTYYRFQQECNGIPVYGRSITVVADKNGNSLSLSGNYLNKRNENWSISPEISEESVAEIVKQHYGKDTIFRNEGLTFYSFNDCDFELAWKIYVSDYGISKYCFVSAISGEVVAELALTYTERTLCSGLDVDGKHQDFYAEYENSKYIMKDTERDICVYDANNSTLQIEFLIMDANNRTYHSDGTNFLDEDNNIVYINGENFDYVITDTQGNVIGTDGEFVARLWTDNIFTEIEPVFSNSANWDNNKAVTLMSRLSSIYEFWQSEFQRNSFDGSYGAIIAVYDDYKNVGWFIGDTQNAASSGIPSIPITILSFGTDNSLSMDVISHEFTHSVERSISAMNYEAESGALMEAYSDIFGEVVEDWSNDGTLNGNCDWIHNGSRNLIEPNEGSSKLPDTYHGDYWINTDDTSDKNDNGGVHINSAVISHAAYLMWKGIDGSDFFEALDTKDLAHLFYETLYTLPSDCTFAQFRTLLQNTADIMCLQGRLSDKQRLCVSNAMFQVGITSAATPVVKEHLSVDIYDINGLIYNDYTLYVQHGNTEEKHNGKDVCEQGMIFPESGEYQLRIVDNANADNETIVYVTAVDQGGVEKLPIFTECGVSKPDDFHTIDSGSSIDKVNIPTDAVEFNGHNYYVYDIDAVTDWNMAQEYCEAQGGYLATITSPDEDAFLYSYITDAGYSSVMFGLTDQEQTDDWRWVTGEGFSYQNWRSGEPNHQGGYEHYGMYYDRNTDGTWNDGSGRGGPFLCEWGEYTVASGNEPTQEPVRTTSDERDIVLVLDASGSMSGTPIEETKKASMNFIDTILEEDASIGIVTYDDNAEQLANFSVDKDHLTEIISALSDGGGTNIEAGLTEAQSMLDSSSAKKKIIVLMSDGEPNEGKEGEELIAYADQIKSDDILIYTLGFFENMGGNKSSAQYLMEQLASDGCHYEVANADDLVFFFEDMADQINGQKYIYIRIACPVDVSVTYNGETLNSAEENQVLRTDFGTLTFEDSEETSSNQAEEQIKVLRLKEGVDYNVKIVGTGRGIMDYTIGFMDENGDYSDFRRFEDIKITKETVIDTVATVSEESVLNIDEDGDGNYDLKLRADENGFGEEVKQVPWLYIVIGGVVILVVALVVSVRVCNKKRRAEIRAISKYCGNCGAKLENSEKVCRHCGRPVDSFLTTASGVIVVGSNRQKKVKRTVRWIAGLIVTVIIATLAVNIASNFTGYYSLLGKILNAYEDDDIDAFVSLSSNAYYYSDENWVENYFENSVSFSLDFFETAVGYRYNLSYEVNEIYVMSERNKDKLIKTLEEAYPEFNTSLIEDVVVANMTVTASQDKKSTSRNIEITMTKEDGEWKILYIE